MDNIAFVQKVKMLCIERNLKPSNVCVECGLGSSFLPDIKRGRVPSVDKVEKLAAYLGVTTSELLGEEIAPTPVDEGGPRYPPEYDLLDPEDQALIESMIRRLILEKNQGDASSPSNGAGSETA